MVHGFNHAFQSSQDTSCRSSNAGPKSATQESNFAPVSSSDPAPLPKGTRPTRNTIRAESSTTFSKNQRVPTAAGIKHNEDLPALASLAALCIHRVSCPLEYGGLHQLRSAHGSTSPSVQNKGNSELCARAATSSENGPYNVSRTTKS